MYQFKGYEIIFSSFAGVSPRFARGASASSAPYLHDFVVVVLLEALTKKIMSKIITKKSIASTKRANRIEDVVSEDLQLMKFEGILVGVSPFKKGSVLCVSAEHQRFHCLLTGLRGDVLTYRKMKDRTAFIKAVETLAQRAGIELEYEDSKSKQASLDFNSSKAA